MYFSKYAPTSLYVYAAATEATAEKEKPVIPPYTGLPSLDNIPSVAGLMAEMAAKKEERRKQEEKKKEEERRVLGHHTIEYIKS